MKILMNNYSNLTLKKLIGYINFGENNIEIIEGKFTFIVKINLER
jgi:hypothetical protein